LAICGELAAELAGGIYQLFSDLNTFRHKRVRVVYFFLHLFLIHNKSEGLTSGRCADVETEKKFLETPLIDFSVHVSVYSRSSSALTIHK
jgi:hypothetical protein